MKQRNKRNVIVSFAVAALVFGGLGVATTQFKSSASTSLAALNVSVTMTDGAQIRLTSGSTGLRYAANVSAGSVAAVQEYAGDKAVYGMFVMPYDYIAAYGAITAESLQNIYCYDGAQEGKAEILNFRFSQNELTATETGYEYRCAITQLKEENYARDFYAKAYIAVPGETETEYLFAPDNASNVRSVVVVAQRALPDYESDEKNTAILNGFIDTVNTLTPNAYGYTTEYYFENDEGAYILDESKTETLLKGKNIGDDICATPPDFAGYVFDEDNTNNVLNGVVYADGSTVLKVCYEKNTVENEVDYYYSSGRGTESELRVENAEYLGVYKNKSLSETGGTISGKITFPKGVAGDGATRAGFVFGDINKEDYATTNPAALKPQTSKFYYLLIRSDGLGQIATVDSSGGLHTVSLGVANGFTSSSRSLATLLTETDFSKTSDGIELNVQIITRYSSYATYIKLTINGVQIAEFTDPTYKYQGTDVGFMRTTGATVPGKILCSDVAVLSTAEVPYMYNASGTSSQTANSVTITGKYAGMFVDGTALGEGGGVVEGKISYINASTAKPRVGFIIGSNANIEYNTAFKPAAGAFYYGYMALGEGGGGRLWYVDKDNGFASGTYISLYSSSSAHDGSAFFQSGWNSATSSVWVRYTVVYNKDGNGAAVSTQIKMEASLDGVTYQTIFDKTDTTYKQQGLGVGFMLHGFGNATATATDGVTLSDVRVTPYPAA